MQRWMTRNIVSRFPIHDAAMAYRRSISIRDNARAHVSSNFMLHMDFADFFHSLTYSDVTRLLHQRREFVAWPLDANDVMIAGQILCRNGRLTIGAPSSPSISNALLYDFDIYWHDFTSRLGVVYTRYADDLTFSSNEPEVLRHVEDHLSSQHIHPGELRLRINKKKSYNVSKKKARRVTGLVLTSDTRVSLGRAKKREIRTIVYLSQSQPHDRQLRERARGYVALAHGLEPRFFASLVRKFGAAAINRIMGRASADD
jgi:hypothetical protein